MKKVAIVGAGGIGSYLAFNLYELQKFNQFSNIGFTFFDDDIVEDKNLRYQKFDKVDIMDYKVECISSKYGFLGVSHKVIDVSELAQYNCIVSAVDNKQFRLDLFKYLETMPEIYWLDLRSEGRSIAYYVKHKDNTYEHMVETLPKEDTGSGSCQLEFELSAGLIQQGNKIIAAIGSQLLLNWIRGDYNRPNLRLMV
ncbi:MAG TPA: ThiF family adenylyltransferase [Bacteroidales bacterium]|mgnify:CR=1 FL=1|nr:ThiF family adenylyltransferase [Bacteroidales bacterium]